MNRVIDACVQSGLPIFFTRDWHPPHHISFKSRGGPWPPHCVQGNSGAEFHPKLMVPPDAVIISKGDDADAEAYSGFQGTDLERRLRKAEVGEIFLGGLTTDYCVRLSTLDAIKAGFRVNVIEDCIRAVDVRQGDGARAIADMRQAGARFVASGEVIKMVASTQQ